ncbi:glycoside hydrolase family 3 [Leekyejoonella antrihumi]|uniref:Glycoside hydrolase family 3 n=1 Tax=Leekyejoonella antrihumi TaxID=1660198 RepID=A0A563E1J7_9MICO|nr:glycoside hydrolase family 3 [Leekyejoonella antrihumi]
MVRLAHGVLKPGFAGRRMPDWLAEAIDQGLRAVCYFGHNVGTSDETAALSAQLHARGLGLIAVDEEGGIVSRLGVHGGSRHVGAAMLGRADDLELTRAVAAAIAADLRAVGIDVDLAPVVDVNSNPDNPVIGVRSFGSDPGLVARPAAAYVRGLHEQGVIACAKHFPGHGGTAVDSHVGLPRVDVSPDVFESRELVPFRAAVDAGAEMVMTAHILVPSIDPDRPATLSPAAMSLLRRDIGFDGVIATDALDMGAITGTVGLRQGCVDALLAGADLLGLGNPVLNCPGGTDAEVFAEALTAIVRAAGSGELPIARLEQAHARVERLASLQRGQPVELARSGPSADDRVAAASILARGDLHGILRGRRLRLLDVRRVRKSAAGVLANCVVAELIRRAPGSVLRRAFDVGGATEGRSSQPPPAAVGGNDDIPDVIVTGAPWSDPAEMKQLQKALQGNPDAVVVCVGYAIDGSVIPQARHLVLTWGDSLPTGRAVAKLLQ